MKRKTKLPCNWRSRLVLIKEIEDKETNYCLEFKKGKTPKGFHRWVADFYIDNTGYIHSNVNDYFQNRGLGTQCYRTILHDVGSLKTTFHSASDQAKSVWRKLIKIYPYETNFWDNYLMVISDSEFQGIPIIVKDLSWQ